MGLCEARRIRCELDQEDQDQWVDPPDRCEDQEDQDRKETVRAVQDRRGMDPADQDLKGTAPADQDR